MGSAAVRRHHKMAPEPAPATEPGPRLPHSLCPSPGSRLPRHGGLRVSFRTWFSRSLPWRRAGAVAAPRDGGRDFPGSWRQRAPLPRRGLRSSGCSSPHGPRAPQFPRLPDQGEGDSIIQSYPVPSFPLDLSSYSVQSLYICSFPVYTAQPLLHSHLKPNIQR